MIRPLPKPKPKRLPERYAVTIIAGFKSYEGVVICADTQETIEHAKRNVPKLRYEPRGLLASKMQKPGSDLAAAFCGAGHGPFIDKLADEAWKVAKPSTSLSDACDAIEASIKRQYLEFGQIYQQGMCPEVQMIYGVKMQGVSRLFDANGPIINEKYGYDCGGVGHYMADFLAERMHHEYLNIYQCVILAAYILYQTKEHVDGCGGDSHIAVLRNDGSSGRVDTKRINALTQILKEADTQASTLLLSPANLDMDEEEFRNNLSTTMAFLQACRDDYRNAITKWSSLTLGNLIGKRAGVTPAPRDFLGLPMLSDDKKPES